MRRLYGAMAELLRKGESFAVATLLDKSGSAPRSEGAKMVVRGDGAILGTIGGGRLEAGAIVLARELIAARRSSIQPFDLTSRDAAASEMICGGSGEILVDFIDAADGGHLAIYQAAAEAGARGEKAWLITLLGKDPETGGLRTQQCLVKPDKTMVGSVQCDPYLIEKMIAGPAKLTIHSEAFDEHRFLVEPLRRGGELFVFGAGHLGQRIAPLAETVGFRTHVLDDRADFAHRARFPAPIEVRAIGSFKELPALGIDEDSYLVIVTRGHLFDKTVLEQVLRSGAAYIGMIGSRSKRDLLYAELMDRGFAREELERVHSPIGTEIGAETPEELAVSIVGELVKVRAGRLGRAKRDEAGRSEPCCRVEAE